MIAIVDYGAGNPSSVFNMLKHIGVASVVTWDTEEIRKAAKIILPGVGAFDTAMQALETKGLKEVLEDKAIKEKVPLLGICLGMQILTRGSEEGQQKGLGWIPAYTYKFQAVPGLKVPHMCWNTVATKTYNPLMTGLEESRFYFVHSYYVKADAQQYTASETTYGLAFDSAIANDNIMGVQFHPEKSHKYGMKLLANFAAL
jgi:glutamine amidotransferase